MIAIRELHPGEWYSYNGNTGEVWRYMPRQKGYTGLTDIWIKVSLKPTHHGYPCIGFNGKSVPIHRVIWWIVRGKWPRMIDHKNRNKTDNRWVNIRLSNHKINNSNRGPSLPWGSDDKLNNNS